MKIAYRASRYARGKRRRGLCKLPSYQEEYDSFEEALLSGEQIALRTFETEIEQGVDAGKRQFFEGCLPVEIIARRGHKALAFGPCDQPD